MNLLKNQSDRIAFEHARCLTAHFSKSFYVSARLLPKDRRWATYALYGFCRYADNLVDNPRNRSKEELLAEIKHISEEIRIAYRTGESEHPVIHPFILVAKKYDIPMEYPLDLLKGVEMDLTLKRYETFEDLYVFCYRVAGVVGLMMTHLLGFKSDLAFQHAEELGIAMQMTNILRDVQEDKEMGRIYLPLEDLREYGLTEADIIHEKMSPQMRKMMKFQVQRAHKYYDLANFGIPMLERKSQFAIYAASKIYRGILMKIEARNYNPFMGRVFVTQKKKLSILLQEIFRTRIFPMPERNFFNSYEIVND